MMIKEKFNAEINKIKAMPTKKRISYIWEYYKFVIIGIIALIVLVSIFVRDYRLNTRPKYLEAILINSAIPSEEYDFMQNDYAKYADVDTGKYNLLIDTSMIIDDENSGQISLVNRQKLLAMYSTDMLDVMIAPEDIVTEYAQASAHKDLTTVISEEYLKELNDAGFELFYCDKYTESGEPIDGEQFVAGICLENSDYLKNYGKYGAFTNSIKNGISPVFTISINTDNIEHSLSLLKMLTGI